MNITRSEIEQIIKLFNEWQFGPCCYITNINEAVEYIVKNLKEK